MKSAPKFDNGDVTGGGDFRCGNCCITVGMTSEAVGVEDTTGGRARRGCGAGGLLATGAGGGQGAA